MTNTNPLQSILQAISSSLVPDLLSAIEAGNPLPPLALRRSARLPMLAALHQQVSTHSPHRPILLLVDRADHALTLLDELTLWLPDAPRFYFPEPNPLFYENAPWGAATRRDRLSVLTTLAAYHIPGAQPTTSGPRSGTEDQGSANSAQQSPIIVAPLRAVMARTVPRRDFLKAVKNLKHEQVIQPEPWVMKMSTSLPPAGSFHAAAASWICGRLPRCSQYASSFSATRSTRCGASIQPPKEPWHRLKRYC